MKRSLMVIIPIVVLFSYTLSAQRSDNLKGIAVGEVAPNIELPLYQGGLFNLTNLKSDIVLINFWASWCSPCRKKMPELIEIYKKFNNTEFENGERGLKIVNVSLDRNYNEWKKAIEKDSVKQFINVGDMKAWKSSAAIDYSIKSIPSAVLIDGNGNVVALISSPQQLRKELRKMKKRDWSWFW